MSSAETSVNEESLQEKIKNVGARIGTDIETSMINQGSCNRNTNVVNKEIIHKVLGDNIGHEQYTGIAK